ncbi:alkaline phosphatase [Candidatus Electronema sp. PJ]|uniref:alkaline phosphatase n=1 Tax=Candidatus Electronema sp. PJ TaxID=3401572 RepID=UPI003AA85533
MTSMRFPLLRQNALMLAAALLFASCAAPQKKQVTPVRQEPKIRNVIVMIGDGMGFPAVGLLDSYAKYAATSPYKTAGTKTALEELADSGVIGFASHEAANVLVTDSAASATQIASGQAAGSEMIGVDANGDAVENIVEKAEKMGKATGLVSDTRLTHATPAGFAAHQTTRAKENEIAVDLLNSGAEVLLSGGLRHFIPQEASDEATDVHQSLQQRTDGKIKLKSSRKDSRNLIAEAEQKGYAVAFTKQQLEQAAGEKILGLFAASAMPDALQQKANQVDPERAVPTLKEMTAKALTTLAKHQKGFFLMVEAGQIDWAEHDNDAGRLLHEMLLMEETLRYLLDWVKQRNDTLLVVLADHNTGGFGFSYIRHDVPEEISLPGAMFKNEQFGPEFNFVPRSVLNKLYAQKISYQTILEQFDALPKKKQKPAALAKLINENSEFPVTEKEAARVLQEEKNAYYVKDHELLGSKSFPKIDDFEAFYVYGKEVRRDLIGRIQSKLQSVVWATGTHTNEPVPVLTYGPRKITAQFGQMMHTTEVGQKMIKVLTGK